MNNIFKKNNVWESKQSKIEIERIEKSFKFSFPPKYYEFLLTYSVGQYQEEWDCYLDKFFRPTPIFEVKIKLEDDYIPYSWLCSPNQIAHNLKFYDQAQSILQELDLLRIGDIVYRGGLFVGVGKNNLDLIYKYSYQWDEKPLLLSHNIYDFLDNLMIIKRDMDFAFEKPYLSKYWFPISNELKHTPNLNGENNDICPESITLDSYIEKLHKKLKHVQSNYL